MLRWGLCLWRGFVSLKRALSDPLTQTDLALCGPPVLVSTVTLVTGRIHTDILGTPVGLNVHRVLDILRKTLRSQSPRHTADHSNLRISRQQHSRWHSLRCVVIIVSDVLVPTCLMFDFQNFELSIYVHFQTRARKTSL